MPDVSIIIPCYNGHAFLAQAVESALRQDLEAKEVIVIDDGSTAPETAEALARLPEEVTVIRQENRGVAAARNRGFEAARGRYVLPLDCDDWIEPDYTRRALELIAGREDAFVYSWLAAFGEYEAVLRKRWDPFGQLIANRLAYCMLIPKALWRRVGGYDETMQLGCEDWDFNIRLGLAGAEGLCLAEPLFHYRVSGDGLMLSTTQRRFGAEWRRIQKKHPDAYGWAPFRQLYRLPRAWPRLAFYGAHHVLPGPLFTLMCMGLYRARWRRRVLRSNRSRRTSRTR